MTMPALHPKSLPLRARRALPGRKVSPLKEGVTKTWTERPPMPMPSAFTPSNAVGLFWTGGRSVPPAGIGLVELADQGGEFEVADSGLRLHLGKAIHVGARLAGEIVAQDVERAGRRRVELDLAGALEAIEPQEGLGHRTAGGQQAVVAQHHRGIVAEVLQEPTALVEVEARALVVVI